MFRSALAFLILAAAATPAPAQELTTVWIGGTDLNYQTEAAPNTELPAMDLPSLERAGAHGLAQMGGPRTVKSGRQVTLRDPAARSGTQTGTVEGRIVAQGSLQPLSATQVQVTGTGLGSLADRDGRYSISDVPAGEVEVRVQRISYATATRTVTVQAGETVTVDFELRPQAVDLDEILVTGTAGQARRREVGNTIAQINPAAVPDPVGSVDDLLQSRAAGVSVNPGTARMGGGAKILLRGNVSASMGNHPLIFVDGVRQSSSTYPQNQSAGRAAATSNEGSPLNDISPADIDRIEIVKGAAAATLYGSEAAAGVIQIFTKQGAEGRARWTYRTDQSLYWTQKYGSEKRPYMDMEQWLRTAHGQTHSLSAAGGGAGVRYYISGRFEDRDGVLPPDEEWSGNVRANITFDPMDNLTVGWTSFFSRQHLDYGPVGGSESIAFNQMRSPNNFFGSERREDMEALLDLIYLSQNDRIYVGLTTTWTPRPEVLNRLTIGFDRASSHHQQIRPFGYVFEERGAISDVQWNSETVTLDYAGSYQMPFTANLSTTFSAGAQFLRTSEQKVDVYGRGLPGPGEHTISSTAERNAWRDEQYINTGGFFIQALTGVWDRYFVTAGLRVDGNSAFGEDFGWQPYPKVSASYVISDESFWRDGWGEMKLRAAYGLAGRSPGAFDATRTWAPQGFVGETAFIPQNIGNAELGPETTREFEVGFDGASEGGRVNFEVTYYDQETSDALFPVQQAPSSGFLGSQLENVGLISNRGFELSVEGILVQRPGLEWSVGGGVTTNNSEVLETGPHESFRIQEGHPMPVVRGTRVVNASQFEDPVLEENAFFGPNLPTHTFDLNTRIRLPRDVVLSARGQYQGGHYMWIWPSHLAAQRGPHGPAECDPVYERVPWNEYDGPFQTNNTHPNLGQLTALERARCYKDATQEIWTFRADFFKVRAITLDAPLPFEIPRTSDVRMTASLGNIWRWTHREFQAWDPETVSNRNQISGLWNHLSEQTPIPATFTFSLRMNF